MDAEAIDGKPVRLNKGGTPIDFGGPLRFPRIVAFSGKYGTGKDSAAQAVLEHIKKLFKIFDSEIDAELDVEHLKFADALKKSSSEMTGISLVDQYTANGKAKEIPGLNMTVGRFQQVLGTVAREHIHPNIWVIPVVNRARDPNLYVVVSDCRFINEAAWIHKLGGVVIRLNRDSSLISDESIAGRDPTHVSETQLDDYDRFDLVVENNGQQFEHIPRIITFLQSLGQTGV
jgi:hypothetical protein